MRYARPSSRLRCSSKLVAGSDIALGELTSQLTEEQVAAGRKHLAEFKKDEAKDKDAKPDAKPVAKPDAKETPEPPAANHKE